jgi:uncharacterized membrane protein
MWHRMELLIADSNAALVVLWFCSSWSLTVVAAMTTISLSQPSIPHFFHVFLLLFLFIFALIESRRYVYYHLVKRRVRLLERGFYSTLLQGGITTRASSLEISRGGTSGETKAGTLSSPLLPLEAHDRAGDDNNQSPAQDQQRWLSQLTESLRSPQPSLPFALALLIRLRRVYLYLMFAVLLTWTLKTWLQGVMGDNVVLLAVAYAMYAVLVVLCCLCSPQTLSKVLRRCRSSSYSSAAYALDHNSQSEDDIYSEVDV